MAPAHKTLLDSFGCARPIACPGIISYLWKSGQQLARTISYPYEAQGDVLLGFNLGMETDTRWSQSRYHRSARASAMRGAELKNAGSRCRVRYGVWIGLYANGTSVNSPIGVRFGRWTVLGIKFGYTLRCAKAPFMCAKKGLKLGKQAEKRKGLPILERS